MGHGNDRRVHAIDRHYFVNIAIVGIRDEYVAIPVDGQILDVVKTGANGPDRRTGGGHTVNRFNLQHRPIIVACGIYIAVSIHHGDILVRMRGAGCQCNGGVARKDNLRPRAHALQQRGSDDIAGTVQHLYAAHA